MKLSLFFDRLNLLESNAGVIIVFPHWIELSFPYCVEWRRWTVFHMQIFGKFPFSEWELTLKSRHSFHLHLTYRTILDSSVGVCQTHLRLERSPLQSHEISTFFCMYLHWLFGLWVLFDAWLSIQFDCNGIFAMNNVVALEFYMWSEFNACCICILTYTSDSV